MGLQSAMTTALTGLQAAETTIDVVGNNVANSNTIGFKESNVLFATQFLQTQSIGSAPTPGRGGTNPRQIGLGAKVAAITPDFTQGTIEISANPLDVAIQGNGFLIVRGTNGEQLYTRNGQLQTNAANEIVTVTGQRVLGWTVDDEFNFVEQLAPLSIPLGEEVVAQATQNAYLSGRLRPDATQATQPGIIQSELLGDDTLAFPTPGAISINDFSVEQPPLVPAGPGPSATAGGSLSVGSQYSYRMAYYKNGASPAIQYESPSSVAFGQSTVSTAGNQTIPLSGLPDAPVGWDGRNLYRSVDGGPYELIADLGASGATYNDDGSATPGATLNDDSLDTGNYSYYVTWVGSGSTESRPTPLLGSFSVSESNRRIRIDNLPQPPAGNVDYSNIRIYRNTTGTNGASTFYEVATLPIGETTFIDNVPDADIIVPGNEINLMGPKANLASRLVDVVVRDGQSYSNPFVEGTLTFTGTKGIRDLAAKELQITSSTTLGELVTFMDQAYGIDTGADSANAGGTMVDGRLQFTSNLGEENELSVKLSAFQMRPTGSTSNNPTSIAFSEAQAANGPGTTTDFIVYDSLGIPLTIRLTTALESIVGDSTTYRWYATSSGNEPSGYPNNVDTVVGTGTIVFDHNGNITSGERVDIGVAREFTASASPLEFTLDFSQLSGLAEQDGDSSMNLKLQDGFSAGTLTSFIVSESGIIRGVYSNGAERNLGQIRMASFANNGGLQQVGENMFITGVNSGEPIIGNPGEGGLGSLTAGAVELSNTDIGQNLIELILASTQYRGGARVITAAQELLDELMSLRR